LITETALKANLAQVQERIAAAAARAGRSPEEITLVAVTKTHPPELVATAFRLGICHFGENRVEEGNPKIEAVRRLLGSTEQSATSNQQRATSNEQPIWHMIGHVQSRKARQVVAAPYALIHSVDRLRIAHRLERFAAELGKVLDILLEVNVGREESKYGFLPEEMSAIVPAIVELPHLRIRGLMTVAPIMEEAKQVRPVFATLRQLRDQLRTDYPDQDWHHLSMGMTDDFEVAVEEGATIVRIGRAIFGPREE